VPFLDGKLLIAMPGMGDPRFERAVIFLCAHSPEGAMGLIVNKPAADLRVKDLLAQLSIERTAPPEARVHFGGPVEHGRGFVLHTAEYGVEGSTLRVSPAFAMTATIDILQDMAKGDGTAQGAARARLFRLGAGPARGRAPGERLADRLGRVPGSRLRRARCGQVGGGAEKPQHRPAAAVGGRRAGLTRGEIGA
jgi:hypothetical protein